MPMRKEPVAPCLSLCLSMPLSTSPEHSLKRQALRVTGKPLGGNSLLQGGQGHAVACPFVCHEPQDHLGYALGAQWGLGLCGAESRSCLGVQMSWFARLPPGQCWRPRAQMGGGSEGLSLHLFRGWVKGTGCRDLQMAVPEVSPGLLSVWEVPQFLFPQRLPIGLWPEPCPLGGQKEDHDDHLRWPLADWCLRCRGC